MEQQEYEYVGKCKGNNEGCFLDSCGHSCGCFTKIKKEFKTETVEEAAERIFTPSYTSYKVRRQGFIEGVKWMANSGIHPPFSNRYERTLKMYSEEEVRSIISNLIRDCYYMQEPNQDVSNWFEQFKKK